MHMTIIKKHTKYLAVAIAIIVATLIIGGTMAYAHGLGNSLEQQVDDILVDIGYSVDEFTDDSSVVFDFEIVDSEKEQIDFTDVWVRLVKDKSTVLATGVHNGRLGGAIMTYKFPEAGEYTLSARFQNGKDAVAEAEFPLTVLQVQKEPIGSRALLFIVLAFIVGLLAGLPLIVLQRKRNTGM